MAHLLLPAGLAFIMFSLGLGLRIEDFRRVFSRRLSVAAGLLAQTVLLPITAFAVCVSLDLPGEIALGVMILSACPGGVTSGMVTRLARGDTALSISLSALTSALAFVTVPVVLGASLWFFADRYADVLLPVGQMVGGLIAVTLAPVALGVWLRESGRAGARFATVVYRAATAVFATIVLVTFVTQWPNMTQHFSSVGPAWRSPWNAACKTARSGSPWLSVCSTNPRSRCRALSMHF